MGANIMKSTNHFMIRNITIKNLPFFIGWIIMFIWLYSYFLPFGDFKFESDLYNSKTSYHIIFTIICLMTTLGITLFLNGREYVRFTYFGVLIAMTDFIILRFTKAGMFSNVVLGIGSACMGFIFASICYAFFMLFNNTEKFYSMLLAILIPKILLLLKPFLNKPKMRIDAANIIIMVLLVILFVCSFLFRNNINGMPEKTDIKPPKKAYTLMYLVFAQLVLNDVIAPTVISSISVKHNVNFGPIYFIGIILGIVLIIIFQKFMKTEIYYMLNLSFTFAALGFVSSALSFTNKFYVVVSLLFLGLSYVLGFINIYYLAGFMTKKFQSVIFYKLGILLSCVFYITSIYFINLLNKIKSNHFTDMIAAAIFISIIILIVFLFSTPFFIKNLSSKEWMDDAYRIDVTYETRLNGKLKDYSLSRREMETCQKLLDGYTLRQIAAIMGISFSTVNTYCNSIYKKLNINSRTELVVMLKEYSLK